MLNVHVNLLEKTSAIFNFLRGLRLFAVRQTFLQWSHEYFGVNTEVVWRTVQEDLPAIIPALRKILKKK